jgi:hypothetical protein
VNESFYVFVFSSLLSLFICFFFLCSRLFGDTCIHDSTDLSRPSFDLSLLLFSSPSLFFMSCSHLISLLCFNLLWDTIFRTATRCTREIWCGQHDCVCDVALHALISISISALSSPTMTCEQTLNHGCIARVSQNLGARLPTDPMITL